MLRPIKRRLTLLCILKADQALQVLDFQAHFHLFSVVVIVSRNNREVGFGRILFGCLHYECSCDRAFWQTIFHPQHQAQSDTQGEHVFLRMTKGFHPLASTHCLTLNCCIFRLCPLPWAFIMRVCEI